MRSLEFAHGAPRAVDCRGHALDASAALAAIRDPTDSRIRSPAPAAVHAAVGQVDDRPVRSRRAVLAAVARARGVTTPQAGALREVRRALDETPTATTGTAAARRALAEAGAERDRLREEVATLRGRVQARREQGLDVTETQRALRDAARDLSERATERAAAEQRLAAARRRARRGFDDRERRLALQDRAANLERAARTHLANVVEPDVRDALAAFPGAETDPMAASPVAFRHAAARVAPLSAPVVVAAGPFDAAAAADWLDAAVIRL